MIHKTLKVEDVLYIYWRAIKGCKIKCDSYFPTELCFWSMFFQQKSFWHQAIDIHAVQWVFWFDDYNFEVAVGNLEKINHILRCLLSFTRLQVEHCKTEQNPSWRCMINIYMYIYVHWIVYFFLLFADVSWQANVSC